MKKVLLAFAAATMLAVSANAMYIIGDVAGGWSPTKGIEMEQVDNGWQWKGTVAQNQNFAFATQLLTTEDWSLFNGQYRISPSEDNIVAKGGEYAMHLGWPDNSFKGCGSECTMLVSEDNGSYKLTVTLEGEPVELSWGLIGAITNWENDMPMDEISDGIWVLNVPELDGEFKFRQNKDWAVNLGGDGSTIVDNGQYNVGQDGLNFKSDNAKNVTLILDTYTGTLTTKFNVGNATPYALRGAINSWGWNGLYCFTETSTPGVYTLTISSIEAESEFKIADAGWNEQYTSQDMKMIALKEYPLTVNDKESGNMAFEYKYDNLTLTLDANNNTLFATTPILSGISEVETVSDEPVYYNLQGVKVANPTNGLYIRVSGNKAEKKLILSDK